MQDDFDINSTFYALDDVYHLGPPLLTIRVPEQITMGYDNQLYSTEYLRHNGVCQPRNKYKWGFSFNLTFAWLLASGVLGLALYAVWLGTFRGGELADAIFGSEKTVLVVAEAYQDAVGGREEALRLDNAELKAAREKWGIGVDVPTSSSDGGSLLGVRARRKRSTDVDDT